MSYITKKQQRRQDLRSALGSHTFKCNHCQVDLSYNSDLLDELFVYLLYRGALLTEENKKTLMMWESARMNEARLVDLLIKLERDHQAHFAQRSITALALGNCPDYSQEPPTSSGSASSVGPDGAGTILYTSPISNDDLDNYGVELWDNYDRAMYDDDGEPIVDEETGEVLIPMDPDLEYREEDAVALATFAGTYSEMRGKDQRGRLKRLKHKVQKSISESTEDEEASL